MLLLLQSTNSVKIQKDQVSWETLEMIDRMEYLLALVRHLLDQVVTLCFPLQRGRPLRLGEEALHLSRRRGVALVAQRKDLECLRLDLAEVEDSLLREDLEIHLLVRKEVVDLVVVVALVVPRKGLEIEEVHHHLGPLHQIMEVGDQDLLDQREGQEIHHLVLKEVEDLVLSLIHI